MEQYLRRNRLAEMADALGVLALIYMGAAAWFVWLWGLGTPAVLAGAALGTLLTMARACLRKRRLLRREKALRSRLGAEMLLEELMLSEAQEAHRRGAELMESRWPIRLESVTDQGALCRQGEERLLLICLRIPQEAALSIGDLLSAQRAVRSAKAQRGVLLVPGKTPPQILARAEEAVTPLRVIGRDTLVELAGRLHPATDEQLVELGKRRRRGVRGGVLALVFRRDKARRYFTYGLGMTLLYLILGVRIYAVAGFVCLTMAVLCRSGRREVDLL